jgi:hypothetical protein
MYVIRDKKTKALLHVAHSLPGEEQEPGELYPEWNPKTMEIGHTEATALPAWFNIEKGKVKETAPPEDETGDAGAEPVELSFDRVKEMALEALTEQSLRLRRELIPDHQLQNAALGIYDDARVATIRATVNAFRDEVNRLEAALTKARSLRDLRGLKPHFPTALVKPPKDAAVRAEPAADAPADAPAPGKRVGGRRPRK